MPISHSAALTWVDWTSDSNWSFRHGLIWGCTPDSISLLNRREERAQPNRTWLELILLKYHVMMTTRNFVRLVRQLKMQVFLVLKKPDATDSSNPTNVRASVAHGDYQAHLCHALFLPICLRTCEGIQQPWKGNTAVFYMVDLNWCIC